MLGAPFMSDTQAAMREFRFLDEKRKVNGLTPAEGQRWQELAVSLGIDPAAQAAQAPAPQGAYGPDGQWYPYVPQGYDPSVWGGAPGAWQGYYPPQPQGYYGPDGQWYQYPPQPQGYYGPDGQWYQYPPQAYAPWGPGYPPQPQGYYGPDGQWVPAPPPPQPQWDPTTQQWVQPQVPGWNAPAASEEAWPQTTPATEAQPPVDVSGPAPLEPALAVDESNEPAEVSNDEVMEIADEEVVEIPASSPVPSSVREVARPPAPQRPAEPLDLVADLRDALAEDSGPGPSLLSPSNRVTPPTGIHSAVTTPGYDSPSLLALRTASKADQEPPDEVPSAPPARPAVPLLDLSDFGTLPAFSSSAEVAEPASAAASPEPSLLGELDDLPAAPTGSPTATSGGPLRLDDAATEPAPRAGAGTPALGLLDALEGQAPAGLGPDDAPQASGGEARGLLGDQAAPLTPGGLLGELSPSEAAAPGNHADHAPPPEAALPFAPSGPRDLLGDEPSATAPHDFPTLPGDAPAKLATPEPPSSEVPDAALSFGHDLEAPSALPAATAADVEPSTASAPPSAANNRTLNPDARAAADHLLAEFGASTPADAPTEVPHVVAELDGPSEVPMVLEAELAPEPAAPPVEPAAPAAVHHEEVLLSDDWADSGEHPTVPFGVMPAVAPPVEPSLEALMPEVTQPVSLPGQATDAAPALDISRTTTPVELPAFASEPSQSDIPAITGTLEEEPEPQKEPTLIVPLPQAPAEPALASSPGSAFDGLVLPPDPAPIPSFAASAPPAGSQAAPSTLFPPWEDVPEPPPMSAEADASPFGDSWSNPAEEPGGRSSLTAQPGAWQQQPEEPGGRSSLTAQPGAWQQQPEEPSGWEEAQPAPIATPPPARIHQVPKLPRITAEEARPPEAESRPTQPRARPAAESEWGDAADDLPVVEAMVEAHHEAQVMVADLDGASDDKVELAGNAEFLGEWGQAHAHDDKAAPVELEADLSDFQVESDPVATLATGAPRTATIEVSDEKLELSRNADFLDDPNLTSTGEKWTHSSPSVEVDGEVLVGEVIAEPEPSSWGAAVLEPPPAPVRPPAANAPVFAPPLSGARPAVPPAPAFAATQPLTQPVVPPPVNPRPPSGPFAAPVPPPAQAAARLPTLPPAPLNAFGQPTAVQTVQGVPVQPLGAAPLPPSGSQRVTLPPALGDQLPPSGNFRGPVQSEFDRSGATLARDESPIRIAGEHRVILHTLEGGVKRGSIHDADLTAAVVALTTGPQVVEKVPRERVKAIFFMLAPGSRSPAPQGAKVRVTFLDGRQVAGYSVDHRALGSGFFVVPADNRTNTERIFIYRHSISTVTVEG